jgi:ribonuclease HI
MTASSERIVCHFDGACGPINPGGAIGMGWTIGTERFHSSNPAAPGNTNNVAEWLALVSLLEELQRRGISATVQGDSQVVIHQMNGVYKNISEHLVFYRDKANALKGSSSFVWVPRLRHTCEREGFASIAVFTCSTNS